MSDIKAFLCDEAKRITTGPRRADYGPPKLNFERIAAFWSVYLQQLGLIGAFHRLSRTDVAAMMRLMKEARLIETPDHLDSYQDLIGYAVTGAEVAGVTTEGTAAKPKTLDNERIVPRFAHLPPLKTKDGPLI